MKKDEYTDISSGKDVLSNDSVNTDVNEDSSVDFGDF